ncbi:MAG TPA: DUF1120 domain-containing protein [Gammaproteobacteria bacterium]|jgi:hypothetical protein|nr:DUF1120 domain-containing protein [Gammaproteobacteria bacterium]
MKHMLSLMTMAIALAGGGQAMAASSVDLSIKGSITPAACTPTLSNGGVVMHGKISYSDLNRYGATKLPTATIALSVNCTALTLFAIKPTDNREGSSSEWPGGPSSFGLGFVNGDAKVGFYSLKMNNSKADGVLQTVIESVDGETWFDALDNAQMWQPNWMRSFKDSAGSGITPVPVQIMSADILVDTTINDKALLPVTQEIPIDGSATLDVVYL